MLTHDALHPGQPLYLRAALAAHGVEANHVKVCRLSESYVGGTGSWERGPGCRGRDSMWEARPVTSSFRG